ncbi:MAG: PH domain-containing protein [Bacilli bacterium]|nr:PH domain-containing protein [Bacilli bacterium]
MAYIKYKELTRYFNFQKEVSASSLPKYVKDYISDGEKILSSYITKKDYGIFTDKKILLFDQQSLIGSKEIHTIYYGSISTFTISFRLNMVDMIIYLDSGYPLRLRFVNLSSEDKTKLRILYREMSEMIALNYNN